jgi:hypothetical protein
LHHTKVKADLGVAKCIADIIGKGYVPCIPLSEHQPYDIVVVLVMMVRQLNYRLNTLRLNMERFEINFRTSWPINTVRIRNIDSATDFDYYAVYCRRKIESYMCRTSQPVRKSFALRKTLIPGEIRESGQMITR